MYCSPTTWRTVPDWESTMGASASMVMEVWALATESVRRRVAGTSASRLMPCWRTEAKPVAATWRSYRPGGTRMNWNRPWESVLVWRVQPVPGLVRSRAALGTTEEEGSATAPERVVMGADWANADTAARSRSGDFIRDMMSQSA